MSDTKNMQFVEVILNSHNTTLTVSILNSVNKEIYATKNFNNLTHANQFKLEVEQSLDELQSFKSSVSFEDILSRFV